MSFGRPTPWAEPVVARFRVLLNQDPLLSYKVIAQQLSEEFSITLTKNACIGFGRRTGVPKRQPPRSYAGRKGRSLKPRIRPHTPQLRIVDRIAKGPPPPPPQPPKQIGRMLLEQLHDRDDCHWPLGDGPPFLFCGAPVTPGVDCVYCLKHAQIAYPALRRAG